MICFSAIIGIGCTHTTKVPVGVITIKLENEEGVYDFINELQEYSDSNNYELSSDNKAISGEKLFLYRLKRSDGLSLLVMSANGMENTLNGMKFQITVYSDNRELGMSEVKRFSNMLQKKLSNIEVSIEYRDNSGRETRFISFPW